MFALSADARCIAPDPEQPSGRLTCTVFTVEFAKQIRWSASIEEIQRAAGSPGAFSKDASSWNWRGEDDFRLSYMTATMRRDGAIDVVVLTDDDVTIRFDNKWRWNCRPESACAPWHNTSK